MFGFTAASSRCAAANVFDFLEGNNLLSTNDEKRGGTRVGAGRPKGTLARRTKIIRAISDRALVPGKTPLDIMLKNMRFYDDKAESLLGVIENKIGDPRSAPSELLELLREMSTFRMSAQKCAVDAAPFIHAKLANITIKPADAPLARDAEEVKMTDEQLSDYYNNLRLRPTSVKPLVIIDNETGELMPEEENAD